MERVAGRRGARARLRRARALAQHRRLQRAGVVLRAAVAAPVHLRAAGSFRVVDMQVQQR